MEAKRKRNNKQTQLEEPTENDEPVFFDIQPALHFNVKEYRARLKCEREERKRLREMKNKDMGQK